MDTRMRDLLEQARSVTMTAAQAEAQRRSFVFGNLAIENPDVTRAMVDTVADREAGARANVRASGG